MTLAPAISPAFGAYLTEWVDWRAIFVLLGVLGVAVFLTVLARLGETNRNRTRLDLAGMAGAYGSLLRSPAFAGFALCSACTSASWFTFIASAPHLLVEALHEPASMYGLMILLPMATYMLGNALAARFAPRFGSLTLLICGRLMAFAGAGAAMLWFFLGAPSVWALFLPIAFAEIGDGLSQPSTMAAGLSIYPRIAGTASGLIGFLQMAMAAIGSFVVALLPQQSPFGMIAVFTGFVVVALGFGLFAVRRQSGGEPVGVSTAPAAAEGG